jgi:hypothetical protein
MLYYKCLSNGAVGEELPKISNKFYPGYIYLANNVPHVITCTIPVNDDFDACIKCRQGHVVWHKLNTEETEDGRVQLTMDSSSNIKYEGDIVEYPVSDAPLDDLFDISTEFYRIMNSDGDLTDLKKTFLSLKVEDIEKLTGKTISDELKENYSQLRRKLSEMVTLMVFKKWMSEN